MMNLELLHRSRVLGSSLTGLTIVLSSSVVLGQQPQPAEQQAQQPQSQAQQPRDQAQQPQAPQQAQRQPGQPSAAQQQQAQQQPQQQQQQQQQRQAGRQPAQQDDVQIAAAAPGVQEAQPMWNGVRVIQVKHDRVAEFEALIKELGAAMQASGQPGFEVFKTELGELNQYHIEAQFDSFASLGDRQTPPMEPADWANWMNRIEATIDSHTAAVARLRMDLSIVPDAEQGQEAPELVLLITEKVMPGKIREYEAMMRDELIPALREADVAGMYANEVTFGAEGRTWVLAVPLPGWEAFDQPSPIVQSLGPQAAEELMMRADALIESSEMTVLRYRPDLSSEASGQGN